jgi:hypothetical protein
MDTTEDAWKPTCILCANRRPARVTELQAGHCCEACRSWLHTTIMEIGFHAHEADDWIAPRASRSATSIAYGSRPPINVDAVDPACTTIELNPGDESSAVTVLEALEMWERAVREDRHYAPYGIASAMRAKPGQLAGDTTATLVGVVDFLAGQIDWITTEPSFGLEEFADHVRRCAGALRRWAADGDAQIGTRIACPSVLEHGSCGAPLRISTGGEPVLCRACGHAWTVEWLIRVAGDDADGWADMEAVCRLSGLHERTIRRWAKAGKVRKRGLLYNVRDISDATSEAASA